MKKTLLVMAMALLLSGCWDDDTREESVQAQSGGGAMYSKMGNVASPAPAMAPAPMMAEADMARDMYASQAPSSMVLDRSTMTNRKIAETHTLGIETTYEALQPRYQRDFAECVKMGCEIINSNIALESGAQIQARIAPDKLKTLLDFLAAGEGEIKTHNVNADDYTMEYSDVDASIKNLVSLRERMAALLVQAKTVDEVLRIEQELSRVQTQLDQHTARMRILQKMTQMATLYINYSVQYSPADVKPYELKNTWKHALNKLLRAVDGMIQFIFAALPWIPVIFVGVWLFVRIVRFALGKGFTSVRWPWRKG